VSEPLASALVVRGGSTRDAAAVRETLEDAIADGDGAVLSVNVDQELPGEALVETLYRICEVAGTPHSKIQVSYAQVLQAAGVQLVPFRAEGEAENHYHAVFREPLELDQIEAFIRCFDVPIDNPTGGKKRREGR
jgi:hypothetical protein